MRLEGPVPSLAPLATHPIVARTCGTEVADRSLEVGPGGELAQAVVFVEGGARLAPPAAPAGPPVLDQRGCLYTPAVLAARAGASLELVNSDPLVHLVRAQAAPGAPPVFNVAMPLAGMRIQRPLPKEPGIHRVRCDVHPWMKAVVRTFDHGHYATTDAEGRFVLPLPAGTHTLVFWHPRLPEVRRQVEVRPNGETALEQVWSSSAVVN